GKYPAFVPTSYTPPAVFPLNWKKGRQSVASENLPGMLEYKNDSPDLDKVVFVIRGNSHRVKDIWFADSGSLPDYITITAELQSFSALENLPLGDQGTTSFYETTGPRKGYVKELHNSQDSLHTSRWSLNWKKGENKKLGKDSQDGIVFATGLLPWRKKASDLRDFIGFARYWGWGL
ncbi:MAG: hypothetical protein D3910_28300, partial [Candidatus Electrothrix sp. ATG2]|nr:hypothetical protein [Candidatus Electrothrix sp. ATG2]